MARTSLVERIDTHDLAQRYLSEQQSMKAIATEYRVNAWVVQTALDRAHIPRRRPMVDTLDPDDLAERYLLREQSTRAMAAELGISKQVVLTALERAGIRRRTARRTRHRGPQWTGLDTDRSLDQWRSVAQSSPASGGYAVAGMRDTSGRRVLVPAATVVSRTTWVASAYLAGLGDKTRSTYRCAVRQWYAWCRDHGVEVLAAHRVHIECWRRYLTEQRGLCARTVAGMLTAVRGLYHYAYTDGLITHNPSDHIRLPRSPRVSTTHGLTRDEMIRLLETAEDHADPMVTALVCVLGLSGMRLGEALGINIEDLGVHGRWNTVHLPRRKNGDPATLSISDRTHRAIQHARGDRRSGPLLLGPKRVNRMRRQIAQSRIRELAHTAGITKRITPHSLRHAFVTLSLDAGVPERDIMASTGHRDYAMIVYYDRARAAIERNATHTLTAYLAGSTA